MANALTQHQYFTLSPQVRFSFRPYLHGFLQIFNIPNIIRLKGVQLCCGQAVDDDLLNLIKTEVSHLYDSVKTWGEENQEAQV